MPDDHLLSLADEPESESVEKKQQVDPSKPRDMLDMVKAIVAMANTRGGRIIVGDKSHPVPKGHLPHFDGATLHNKVQAYVDPPVGNITSRVEEENAILVIEIGESTHKPHVFKSDGNYQDPTNPRRQRTAFYRGTILVRHASKTEIMCRADFDRFLAERQARLFQNVKMVFDAPPGGIVTVGPPSPAAITVTTILDSEPFGSLEQELLAAVKAWKSSGQLLNDQQVYKAYVTRHVPGDEEVLELLLRSSLARWLPSFYWASRLTLEKLEAILESVVGSDCYPAASEALKVSALLPWNNVTKVFALASASKKQIVHSYASRFQELCKLHQSRKTKVQRLRKKLCPTEKMDFTIGGAQKSITDEETTEEDATKLAELLSSSIPRSQDKALLRRMDLILYGPLLPDKR